jgi:hypothetical protein
MIRAFLRLSRLLWLDPSVPSSPFITLFDSAIELIRMNVIHSPMPEGPLRSIGHSAKYAQRKKAHTRFDVRPREAPEVRSGFSIILHFKTSCIVRRLQLSLTFVSPLAAYPRGERPDTV